jgi:NAD(P)-dependent dehydrogenase (short-subunit alcohol dehydrogenase family)
VKVVRRIVRRVGRPALRCSLPALPIALVTGANRGIGRETTRQLAERGYEVIVSARDEDNAREAAEAIGGRPLQLDVSDPASIERAAAAVTEDPGNLDVLVNNAGIGSDFGVSGTDPDFDALQRALDTNFFGAYRLTVALLPLLRHSEHARVVNVSSGMGGITEMGGWSPGYRVSKAALNAMTRILSTELEGDGVKVNSACPGLVATDMGSQFGAAKPVEDGASGVVWLATLPDDGPSGGFFRDGKQIAF